jgi:hypothetical protein
MVTTAIASPDLAEDKPPGRKRWIPVSFRMLVAILAILGIGTGRELLRICRQEAALREIERLQGTVILNQGGPKWLWELVGHTRMEAFDEVCVIHLWHKHATDETLHHIGRLTSLRELQLDGTPVTDAGLQELSGLNNLKELFVAETQVTDTGVAELQRALPTLRILR